MGSSGALWAGLIKINYTNQIKNKIPLKTLNLQKALIFKVLNKIEGYNNYLEPGPKFAIKPHYTLLYALLVFIITPK